MWLEAFTVVNNEANCKTLDNNNKKRRVSLVWIVILHELKLIFASMDGYVRIEDSF